MIVRHYEDVEAIEIMEGVTRRIVIGDSEGAPTFIMRIFDLEPGKSSPFHIHPWEHEIFVLQGAAVVTNHDGEVIPVKEGDTVFIPPTEKHCLTNNGDSLFRFMCLIPRNVNEAEAKTIE
jgi:quercetin dioxygenase-like cupin family protein